MNLSTKMTLVLIELSAEAVCPIYFVAGVDARYEKLSTVEIAK